MLGLYGLASALAACGGNATGMPGPDASTGTGTHHTYVVSTMHVPSSMSDAQKYGVDLGSATSDAPDGTVDNKLGTTLGQLLQLTPGTDTIAASIAKGDILLLVDVQATDLASATGAGFTSFVGANPSPTPCSGPTDTICARHLDGHGSFDVSANDPHNGALTGNITGGTLDGGPGDLVVQFAADGSTVATVNLMNARVHATGLSASGVDAAVLGGAVTSADMENQVLPAIRDGLLAVLMRDCGVNCSSGCKSGSDGATIKTQFGTCAITVDAIKNQPSFAQALAPDVCIEASCSGGPDGISLGLGVSAVDGTFTP